MFWIFVYNELDRKLDLHYFGARYYHADLPRFISPDLLRRFLCSGFGIAKAGQRYHD